VVTSPVTTRIGWVTGPGTVTPSRFGIYGTDVGIMWDNGMTGDNRQVLTIFGDTFSAANQSGVWRSNVLLRTSDPDRAELRSRLGHRPVRRLSAQRTPGMSKQVINGSPSYLGLFGSEVTVIPTAAISVPYDNAYGARQYVNFMSVRSRDFGGAWTTNYSAIAYSDDYGQNWTVAPQTIRAASWLRSSKSFVYGNQNFQQGAFVKPSAASPDAGYVYSFGTPSGRMGSAYVSRVKEADILDLTKYDYWNGDSWTVGDPAASVPILPPTTKSQNGGGFLGKLGLFFGGWVGGVFGVGGPNGHVSEMSVQYNTYLDTYVTMYSDGKGTVVMRTGDAPQGTWSDATPLVDSLQYPSLYAPTMDPWSTGQDIYWNLSLWGDYNVALMKTTLV
jgi:D-arabinan endo alpha-(1,5)-arabinofuranosidase